MENIDKNDIFFLCGITVIVLFISIKVVKLEIAHVAAIGIILAIFISRLNLKKTVVEFTNNEILEKYNNLSPEGKVPEFMYIDADLIIVFDKLKKDFYRYNPDSYNQALECAGNVLEIVHDFERKLCKRTNDDKKTNIFNTELKIKDNIIRPIEISEVFSENCDNTLENSYENYQVAEENRNKCVNYVHSLVYSIPSEEILHQLFYEYLDKINVLLKRNLDFIRNMHYKKNTKKITSNTRYIHDYDLPKGFTNQSIAESAFNYF